MAVSAYRVIGMQRININIYIDAHIASIAGNP